MLVRVVASMLEIILLNKDLVLHDRHDFVLVAERFHLEIILFSNFLVWYLVNLKDFVLFNSVFIDHKLQGYVRFLAVCHCILVVLVLFNILNLRQQILLAITHLDEEILDCMLEIWLINPLLYLGSPDRYTSYIVELRLLLPRLKRPQTFVILFSRCLHSLFLFGFIILF